MTTLNDRDLPVYPIGTVEKLTGLTSRQIRYYELKGLVHPQRTEGNQRLFSPAQVERLRRIKEMLDAGYSLRNVQEILKKEGKRREVAPTLDDYPARERLARGALTSLYPVTDHARLTEILERGEQRRRGE